MNYYLMLNHQTTQLNFQSILLKTCLCIGGIRNKISKSSTPSMARGIVYLLRIIARHYGLLLQTKVDTSEEVLFITTCTEIAIFGWIS